MLDWRIGSGIAGRSATRLVAVRATALKIDLISYTVQDCLPPGIFIRAICLYEFKSPHTSITVKIPIYVGWISEAHPPQWAVLLDALRLCTLLFLELPAFRAWGYESSGQCATSGYEFKSPHSSIAVKIPIYVGWISEAHPPQWAVLVDALRLSTLLFLELRVVRVQRDESPGQSA
ncbi:MAG: hypothetical protein ACRER2_16210, partial [Methylococcales bacterium]